MEVAERLLVTGCPYCNYFKKLPDDVVLHYPLNRDDIDKVDFIVIDCEECGSPIVIYGEHISEVTRQAYGKILFRCKLLFGANVVLKEKHKLVRDHWCLHRVNKF